MIAYCLVGTHNRWIEDVFVGNGDELTPAAEKSLRDRAKKLGFSLIRRAVEPANALDAYLTELEDEERKAEAEPAAPAEPKKTRRVKSDG